VGLTGTSTQRRLLAGRLESLRLQETLESLGLDMETLGDTHRLVTVATGVATTGLGRLLLALFGGLALLTLVRLALVRLALVRLDLLDRLCGL